MDCFDSTTRRISGGLRLDGAELDLWEWVRVDHIGDYLNPRLHPRLAQEYNAHQHGTTLNLEHGSPPSL